MRRHRALDEVNSINREIAELVFKGRRPKNNLLAVESD